MSPSLGHLSTWSCVIHSPSCLCQSHTMTITSSCHRTFAYMVALSIHQMNTDSCVGGVGKEKCWVPPGPFLHGSDLHPNHHTDCVLEPECVSVPWHAVCAQNLRHPVPPGAECAEAEAEPQGDLNSGSPTQGRGHRGPQVVSGEGVGVVVPSLLFFLSLASRWKLWQVQDCSEQSEAGGPQSPCPPGWGWPPERPGPTYHTSSLLFHACWHHTYLLQTRLSTHGGKQLPRGSYSREDWTYTSWSEFRECDEAPGLGPAWVRVLPKQPSECADCGTFKNV